jgi:WD40 repeat protein
MAVEVKSKAPAVMSVDYSRDGGSVIYGAFDETVRLWDLSAAKQIRKFKGNSSAVTAVTYSPDGKTIAVASLGGMTNFSGNVTTLWDIASGREISRFSGNFGGRALSFSPDGRLILGSSGGFGAGTIGLVDVQTGNLVKEFKGYEGRISPDGKLIATVGASGVTLVNLVSGQEMWKSKIDGGVGAFAFSPDSKTILVARNKKPNMGADLVMSFILLDVTTGNLIKEFGHSTIPSGMFDVKFVYHQVGALAFSPDGRFFLSGDLGGKYKLWELATGMVARQLKTVDETTGTLLNVAPSAAFSPDGRVAAVTSLAAVRFFDISTGDELATLIGFEDGEWLVTTPSGYYNSSEKGDQYLNVSIGNKPYSIAQLRESFFRPDLVKLALSGGPLKEHRKIADIKPPPVITITDTPASAESEEVTVKLRVVDQGGGVGDVRLYLNGSAVVLESTRTLAVSATSAGNMLSYKLRLTSGKNTLRAIAFNADNSMQSTDALHEIESRIAARRPSLYAVAVGIQEYVNPKLTLKYSMADANLFADTLKAKAGGLFEKVEVIKLVATKDTTNAAIAEALTNARAKVRPDDLFVFYVASHGTVDEGEYYLVTSNVGSTSTEKLKRDALSQNRLKELIANIPATKKLIVLDTCNAGKLGDTLQVALLTRGMNEDTAFKILSRAVGSTILSAATSQQEALEGYQDHGLFTWVLAEGLKGAADLDQDGFIKTIELASYVDDKVPELAEKVFRHKQFPVVAPSGQAFPVVRVR